MKLRRSNAASGALTDLLTLLDEYKFEPDVEKRLSEYRKIAGQYEKFGKAGRPPIPDDVAQEILSDPDPSAASVASRHGVTKRTIYNLRKKHASDS